MRPSASSSASQRALVENDESPGSTTDGPADGASKPRGRATSVIRRTTIPPAPLSETERISSTPSDLPAIQTPAKPLLASEALMEDLAPVEPARQDARAWCAACGIVFILFGLLPLAGFLPGGLGSSLPWL